MVEAVKVVCDWTLALMGEELPPAPPEGVLDVSVAADAVSVNEPAVIVVGVEIVMITVLDSEVKVEMIAVVTTETNGEFSVVVYPATEAVLDCPADAEVEELELAGMVAAESTLPDELGSGLGDAGAWLDDETAVVAQVVRKPWLSQHVGVATAGLIVTNVGKPR